MKGIHLFEASSKHNQKKTQVPSFKLDFITVNVEHLKIRNTRI